MVLRRWLLFWLTLILFSTIPAVIVLGLFSRAGPQDSGAVLLAEASGRALAFDAHFERLSQRVKILSEELSAVMQQLPPGPIGSAAEGTLMLHLQQRLAQDQEIGEYSVLSPEGKVLLSTDGTKVGGTGRRWPEIPQRAPRPLVSLLKDEGATAAFVTIGAPMNSSGDKLLGYLVAQLRPQGVMSLCQPSQPPLHIDLVDANGLSLMSGSTRAELAKFGTQSVTGKDLLHGGARVAFVPLKLARAVVLVSDGGPSEKSAAVLRPGWSLMGGGGAIVVLLAALVAWMMARQRPTALA
jgi:hypothetical protein